MKGNLEWFETVAVPDENEVLEIMEFKVLRGKSTQKESKYLTSENSALCTLGSEQVCYVLRASLAVHT